MLRGMNLTSLGSELLTRLPTMTEEERRLGLEIYRQLARGMPVLKLTLAGALKISNQEVGDLLGRANLGSLTYMDHDGRIIGFGGLAVREMPHRFKLDGRTLYTWCAWDSLFIPIILDQEAEVESPVPGTTADVRLRIAPNGVIDVRPRSAFMSFLLPTAQAFQADAVKAMASFCHYIFFFPDRDAAAAWTRSHPDTTVISMSDAFELGRRMVSTRWRPAL